MPKLGSRVRTSFPAPFLSLISLELARKTVDAISLTRLSGTVGENVTEVTYVIPVLVQTLISTLTRTYEAISVLVLLRVTRTHVVTVVAPTVTTGFLSAEDWA